MQIEKEIAAIQQMTTGQLQERYAEVFGEVPRSRHKTYLIRKIAWRLQALAEGDLSERARRRAEELAIDAEVRTTPPKSFPATNGITPARRTVEASRPTDLRLPSTGTSIIRKYKGRMLEVRVLADGLEYDGRKYKSLSSVAKAITGSHCNGFRFFNLEVSQ